NPHRLHRHPRFFSFLFNDTPTNEIYTLSLHDALPISIIIDIDELPKLKDLKTKPLSLFLKSNAVGMKMKSLTAIPDLGRVMEIKDRKSTRLNSSHVKISYAVFCLKKKRNDENVHVRRD